jgi:DNA-binding transcriptional LysR family regulator
MKIELRQLRHVVELDRYRNFARAAEALGLTQPALTRSLQALEKSVGTRLFDRDRSLVQPTLVGERLIARARPLLNEAHNIEHDVQQLLGLEAGLLRIGAGPYAADISVGIAVGRLIGRHPGLVADVSVAPWSTLVSRVVENDLDLAVAELSLVLDDERLSIEPLPQHDVTFFCRAAHPLARRTSVAFEELRQFPFVTTVLPPRLARLTDASNAKLQGRLPQDVSAPEIRVETVGLAIQVVKESDAISGAVVSQIEAEIDSGSLVTLPIELPWAKSHYGIIRMANRTPAPAAVAFIEILREVETEVATKLASDRFRK